MGRSVHGQYDPGHHHQRRHARAGCSLAGRGHAGTQHRHRADAGQVGSVVFSLRDGTQLCQAYQCRTKKNCPRGAHRCGVVLQSGRVCGFKQPCDTQWAAPLPGGGEANRWTLLSFTTFVPFWMSWSPLTCTSPKPHHALPSLTFSAVSMPPCPRPFVWEIITPIDIEIDRTWTCRVRRSVGLFGKSSPGWPLSLGLSCATKSRAREKRPGPPPLRFEGCPRGLQGLDSVQQDRVDADNYSSDYLLALQHWGHLQNLA